MGEWMPIESAPKDGTAVLVWLPGRYADDEPWAAIACYRADDPPPLTPSPWQSVQYGQGFSCIPTHWMPIPDPPAGSADPSA